MTFLERERVARDTARVAAAIAAGTRVIYSSDLPHTAQPTITLPPPVTELDTAADLDAFEHQLTTEGHATAYVFENGTFREITVTHDDGGPLTDEEVAIMLREEAGEKRHVAS